MPFNSNRFIANITKSLGASFRDSNFPHPTLNSFYKKSLLRMTGGVNMKPTADGTFREAGAPLEEYVMEMENGAKAICRTFGGNCFSYITKDGIEVMGKRKDAVDIKSDSNPYAGGTPHCFPQVRFCKSKRLTYYYLPVLQNFYCSLDQGN